MSPDNNFLYVALDPGYNEWGVGLTGIVNLRQQRRFIARNKMCIIESKNIKW